VPTSAIKTQGDTNYVEVFSTVYTEAEAAIGIMPNTSPTQKVVVVGIADDTNTEIISGLSEGDQIVIRTVTVSSQTKKSTTSSTGSSLFGTGTSNERPSSTSGGAVMGGPPM
jgi:heterodisulfide reductase subunit C